MPAAASDFNNRRTSLRFPTEIASDEIPNYITFTPTVVEFGAFRNGPDAASTYGNAFIKPSLRNYNITPSTQTLRAGPASITLNNPFQTLRNRIDGFVQGIAEAANVNFDLPGGLGNVNFNLAGDGINNIISGRLNLGSFNIDIGKAIQQNPNTVTSLPGINLYLPPELASKVQARYNAKDLGAAGQEAINFVGNSLADNLNIDTVSRIATAALGDIVSEPLNGVIQRSEGRAKNNYSYAIFNGMEHRKFTYKFTLVAKNKQETKTIKDICDAFMYYMLPIQSPDDFHFFDVPCMWKIGYYSYHLQGDKIPYFDQPRNCFLESANVTYGNGALGHTYNDGAPSTVNLELSFMEIEPLLRVDGDRVNSRGPLSMGLQDRLSSALTGARDNTGTE